MEMQQRASMFEIDWRWRNKVSWEQDGLIDCLHAIQDGSSQRSHLRNPA